MDLPKPLQPGLPLSGDELVRVRQGSVWVYPKLSDIVALATGPINKALATINAAVTALSSRADTLEAEASAANDATAALAKSVANLEARPSIVVLSGSLPLATLQIGSTDVSVPVKGLLKTDLIVSAVPGAAVPSGLALGYARPLTTMDGILIVQSIAGISLAGKPALPLTVNVLR